MRYRVLACFLAALVGMGRIISAGEALEGERGKNLIRLLEMATDFHDLNRIREAKAKLDALIAEDPSDEECWKLRKMFGIAALHRLQSTMELGRAPLIILERAQRYDQALMRSPENIAKVVAAAVKQPEESPKHLVEIAELGAFAVPELVEYLWQNTDVPARTNAAFILTSLGRQAVLPLVECLSCDDDTLIQRICGILMDIRPPDARAIPALKRIYEDPKRLAPTRAWAAKALQAITGKPVEQLRSAAEYYLEEANRYYLGGPLVKEEMDDLQESFWVWDPKGGREKKGGLQRLDIPQFALDDLLVEELLFDGMEIAQDPRPFEILLASSFMQAGKEVDMIDAVVKLQDVTVPSVGRLKEQIGIWTERLYKTQRLAMTKGAPILLDCLDKALLDGKTTVAVAALENLAIVCKDDGWAAIEAWRGKGGVPASDKPEAPPAPSPTPSEVKKPELPAETPPATTPSAEEKKAEPKPEEEKAKEEAAEKPAEETKKEPEATEGAPNGKAEEAPPPEGKGKEEKPAEEEEAKESPEGEGTPPADVAAEKEHKKEEGKEEKQEDAQPQEEQANQDWGTPTEENNSEVKGAKAVKEEEKEAKEKKEKAKKEKKEAKESKRKEGKEKEKSNGTKKNGKANGAIANGTTKDTKAAQPTDGKEKDQAKKTARSAAIRNPVLAALSHPNPMIRIAAANCLIRVGMPPSHPEYPRLLPVLVEGAKEKKAVICLVVSSVPERRKQWAEMLESQGILAMTAASGRDAYALATQFPPKDAILLDHGIQEFLFLHDRLELRKMIGGAPLPITIITRRGRVDEIKAQFQKGPWRVQTYLDKTPEDQLLYENLLGFQRLSEATQAVAIVTNESREARHRIQAMLLAEVERRLRPERLTELAKLRNEAKVLSDIYAIRQTFANVYLDEELSGFDEIQTVQSLRTDPRTRPIPIALLTDANRIEQAAKDFEEFVKDKANMRILDIEIRKEDLFKEVVEMKNMNPISEKNYVRQLTDRLAIESAEALCRLDPRKTGPLDETSVTALREVVADPSRPLELRTKAALALAHFNAEAAAPTFAEVFRNEKTREVPDAERPAQVAFRAACIEALGRVDRQNAFKDLKFEAIDERDDKWDPHHTIQQAAAVAFSRVAADPAARKEVDRHQRPNDPRVILTKGLGLARKEVTEEEKAPAAKPEEQPKEEAQPQEEKKEEEGGWNW